MSKFDIVITGLGDKTYVLLKTFTKTKNNCGPGITLVHETYRDLIKKVWANSVDPGEREELSFDPFIFILNLIFEVFFRI